MVYNSKQNAKIKLIASLKDKKHRQKQGMYLLEGIKMVREAINNNFDIQYIVIEEDREYDLSSSDSEVLVVSKIVMDYLSDAVSHQGILAVVKIKSFDSETIKGNSCLLDNIQDPGNLGTIMRTMVACGYSNLILLNCCDPYSPKVIRSSMSGIFFVNIIQCNLERAKGLLSDSLVVVADLDGQNLFSIQPSGKQTCIVIGNEANGVSDQVKELSNLTVTIPMSKNSESLNAGVAFSIIAYQLTYSKNT